MRRLPWLLLVSFACRPAAPKPSASAIPRDAGTHSSEQARRVAGLRYDPYDIPLAWRATGELVVSHAERYSQADVVGSTCSGSGIWLVPAAGGPLRVLAVGAPICNAVLGNNGLAVDPSTQWLVYSAITQSNSFRLVRLNLTTGTEDSLPTGCQVYHGQPAWSPDGSFLATEGLCEGRDAEAAIYLMRPDGSGLRRVGAVDSLSRERPAVGPDGRWIVFEQTSGIDDRPVHRIAIMDTLGGHERVPTSGNSPAWSPDGQWIAYLAEDPERTVGPTVRLIRPDGGGEHVLFRSSEQSSFSRGWGPIPAGVPSAPLVWSPDSKFVAFPRSFDQGTTVWRIEVGSGRLAPITRVLDQPASARRGP